MVEEDDEDDEEEEEEEVDVDDEDDDADVHDSVSDTTGSLIGNGIDDTGVRAGTFTVNVYRWPPSTVTVTRQVSADATGIEASPITTSATLAVTNPTNSFRLLNTVSQLLPPRVRKTGLPRPQAAYGGRY